MLLAPLIAALLDAGHQLGMVTRGANRDLYRADLVRAHVYDETRKLDGILAEIAARTYDIALIATEKPIGYRLARLARIPTRIGFWNGALKPFKGIWARSQCTGLRYRPAHEGRRHEVEVLFDLGRGLHGEGLPTRDVSRLRNVLLDTLHRDGGKQRVLQITEKWRHFGSISQIAEFLRRVESDFPVRFIGAAREQAFLDDIEIEARISVTRFRETGPWMERIAQAEALITPDTGAAHVAGMLGTPVVDIFSETSSSSQRERWSPWAAPSLICTMRDLRGDGIEILRKPITAFSMNG